MSGAILLADIGGTNARFALADSTQYVDAVTVKCRDFPNLEAAISDYLAKTGVAKAEAVYIAAAGPVVGGVVDLVNNDWQIDQKQLMENCQATVRIINDFEAMAWSLPALEANDVLPIECSNLLPLAENYRIGVLGPGTGLGAGGLLADGTRRTSVVTEAGHAGFSPQGKRQLDVYNLLAPRFGRVSNERLLSGPGAENIYRSLCWLRSGENVELDAASIFERCLKGTDEIARETVEVFFEILGQVAGDFVLSTGTFDGLFLCGGVIQPYRGLLASSGFRKAFENKGRLKRRLVDTPTFLVTHEQPGLLGVSELAREESSQDAFVG